MFYQKITSLILTIKQHRIFQQFTAIQTFGKVKLGHRYRFEHRFVESNFKMRFRYFLSLNIPINIMENNKYYLSAYNEIFLNTKTSVFDRNRLYVGIGYNINTEIWIEVGHMNQFFERSSRDQLNIITFVNF
jgi:hypothetical protein